MQQIERRLADGLTAVYCSTTSSIAVYYNGIEWLLCAEDVVEPGVADETGVVVEPAVAQAGVGTSQRLLADVRQVPLRLRWRRQVCVADQYGLSLVPVVGRYV